MPRKQLSILMLLPTNLGVVYLCPLGRAGSIAVFRSTTKPPRAVDARDSSVDSSTSVPTPNRW